ncbi:MAG: cupin domain-containing protein [Gemmataceae bacterium]
MPFIDIDTIPRMELSPGVRLRTPFGQNIMLSYVEFEEGGVVAVHHHPHEQAGMLLQGRLELTIGDETRVIEPGAMYIVPPNVPHRATAVGGPAVVLDIFSPIREDYAARLNTYVPAGPGSG